MGLISNTVKMKWYNKTKRWYESKGYIFTRYKDEFEVKVEDLPSGSDVLVDVRCDCEDCSSPYLKSIKWGYYLKQIYKNGKYYCKSCAHKLTHYRKRTENKLNNGGKSLYNWCIENNHQDILVRWDYELNNYKPNEISYGTHEKHWFKCSRNLHKSELRDIHGFTTGRQKSLDCKQCNSFAQYLVDAYGINALELYWDYGKNILNPWRIDKKSRENIYINCQKHDYHGSHRLSCNAFTIGNGCPYCVNKNGKVHAFDSLGTLHPKSINIWSGKNKKSPYEYTSLSNQKVWWRCLDGHDDYYRQISNATKCEFRCPECVKERAESFLQEKVRLYLESLNNNNYTILHEHNCTIIPKNPKSKTNNTLPFDNEVKELKLICEVHGLQHYKLSKWHTQISKQHDTIPEYELHMQQVRDRYKKFIAYKQGYNYIAIPYWTDDKIETWKTLINDKIIQISI